MSNPKPITDQTQCETNTDNKVQPFWLLREGTAKKVGKQATGAISYQLLSDFARSTLSIAIVGNQTGGYFSREHVPLSKIEHCISQCEAGKPMPSKCFKDAFVGRSSNNSGFLAAILRAEGLLIPAAEAENRHMVAADWQAWQVAALAEPGALIEPPAINDTTAPPENGDGPPASAEPALDHKKTLTLSRRKGA